MPSSGSVQFCTGGRRDGWKREETAIREQSKRRGGPAQTCGSGRCCTSWCGTSTGHQGAANVVGASTTGRLLASMEGGGTCPGGCAWRWRRRCESDAERGCCPAAGANRGPGATGGGAGGTHGGVGEGDARGPRSHRGRDQMRCRRRMPRGCASSSAGWRQAEAGRREVRATVERSAVKQEAGGRPGTAAASPSW